MARGVLQHSQASYAVAITGIAGPGGGSVEKPVGSVWVAWASMGGKCDSSLFCYSGDRSAVRWHALEVAIEGLLAGDFIV